MNKKLSLYKIFILYKNEFPVNLKEAYNSVKNSRQFNSHNELLELETLFADLTYLTSYETFGKLEDLIITEDIDNRTNFLRFKSAIPQFYNILEELHTNLKSLIKIMKNKEKNIDHSKDHLDLYRIANCSTLLQQTIEPIPNFFTFFDITKALIALGYNKDIDYVIKNLTFGYISEVIEKKDHEKLQNNISKMQDIKIFKKRQTVRKIVSEQNKNKINFDEIMVFCGFNSSNDTLATKEDYFNALRKKINQLFKEIQHKNFILPKFYYHLKNFVFEQIKNEIKTKQILYVIDEKGNKIYPFEVIKNEVKLFFKKNTKKTLLSSADFKEQEQKIADDIFFEIANIENLLSKELKNSSVEGKKLLILRYITKSSANVYKYLLPETKKIDTIVEEYLRRH